MTLIQNGSSEPHSGHFSPARQLLFAIVFTPTRRAHIVIAYTSRFWPVIPFEFVPTLWALKYAVGLAAYQYVSVIVRSYDYIGRVIDIAEENHVGVLAQEVSEFIAFTDKHAHVTIHALYPSHTIKLRHYL